MPLISTSSPNLINGVSQQPDALRYPSQCREQENFLGSVTEGLVKRPPTSHIANIWEAYGGNVLCHTIDRGEGNRYLAAIKTSSVKVFDVANGTEQTVTLESGVSTYLTSSDAKNRLRALTVADYTFILNRDILPAMTASKTEDPRYQSFVTIIQGAYDKDYSITIGKSFTTGTYATIALAPSGSNNNLTISAKIYGPQYNATLTREFRSSLPIDTCRVTYEFRRLKLAVNGTVTAAQVKQAFLDSNTAKDYFTCTSTGGDGDSGTFPSASFTGTMSGGAVTVGTPTTYTFTSSATLSAQIQTDYIAEQLYNALTHVTTGLNGASVEGYTSWVVKRSGSTLLIYRTDKAAFPVLVSDSISNTAMSVVKDEVESISDLPKICKHGFVTKILGLADENGDDYYVRFVGENKGQGDYEFFDSGVWIEAAAPNITYKIDETTMPHALVENTDGTWSVKPVQWGERKVGDEDTNPNPSFIAKEIRDMFFHKNRLGLLAGENTILSEAGEPFNFYRTSILTLLDSDPIDVASTHTKVSELNSALPFADRLLMFSDQTQFSLSGGEILTPKTVSIAPSSEYANLPNVRPVAAGQKVFFGFDRGSFSGVYEYYLDPRSVADQFQGFEITAHVPKYIEGTITKMAVSINENMLVCQADGLTNGFYVYKWFELDGSKLQSAWCKFTFGGATVVNVDFINSVLYIVLARDGDLFLESMNIQPGLKDENSDYTIFLDRRLTENSAGVSRSYSSVTNRTTFTLPYDIGAGDDVQVVTRFDDPQAGVTGGIQLQKVSQGVVNVVVSGDHTLQEVWIGNTYDASIQLSNPTLKAGTDSGGRAILATGRYQLIRGHVVFDSSRYFKVKVTPLGRDTFEYVYTGQVINTSQSIIGEQGLGAGVFRFPILAANQGLTIEIENSSPYPSAIVSADWEANYNSKSQRFTG